MQNKMIFNFEITALARKKTKGNLINLLLLSLMVLIAGSVLSTLIALPFGGVERIQTLAAGRRALYSVLSLICNLILLPASIGVQHYALSVARDSKPEDFFEPVITNYRAGTFVKIVKIYILQAVIVFLFALLLIIPGIIKALGYSQTAFLIKDRPELGAYETLKKSEKIMKGHRWQIFCLGIYYVFLSCLSAVLLFIPLIWLVPRMQVAFGVFYCEALRAYCGEPESRQADAMPGDEATRERPGHDEDGNEF